MSGARPPLAVVSHGEVPFDAVHTGMLDDQRARAAGSLVHDRLRLFSPHPVVTRGSGADARDLLLSPEDYAARGVSIHEVDRGGETTYHGPGQRVGYLTLALGPDERDLHRLLRSVEGALIEALADYGVTGSRVEGRTGVWVGPRKIASIGLSVRRWVTGHGFALCVAREDPDPFEWIVPCGVRGCPTTSIEAETGTVPDRGELDTVLARALARALGRPAELGTARPGTAKFENMDRSTP